MTGSYDDFFWATGESSEEDLQEYTSATMKAFCNLPQMEPEDELADMNGLTAFLHADRM